MVRLTQGSVQYKRDPSDSAENMRCRHDSRCRILSAAVRFKLSFNRGNGLMTANGADIVVVKAGHTHRILPMRCPKSPRLSDAL